MKDSSINDTDGSPAAKLFRRYIWLLVIAGLLLSLGLLVQLLMQFSSWRATHLADVHNLMQVYETDIDRDMRATTQNITALNLRGEQFLERKAGYGGDAGEVHPALEYLVQSDNGQYFSLPNFAPDSPLPQPRGLEGFANIFGAGFIEDFDEDMLSELIMAANLADLQGITLSNPALYLRSYYLSVRRFAEIYPFTSVPELFDESEYVDDIYSLFEEFYSQPSWLEGAMFDERNASAYWTRATLDDEFGLFVTNAMRIYDMGNLMGVVATEVSLQPLQLNFADIAMAINLKEEGQVLLVNNFGQILANSGEDMYNITEIGNITDYVPEDFWEGLKENLSEEIFTDESFNGEATKIDGQEIFVRPLNSVPWVLVYVSPSPNILALVKSGAGLYLILVLVFVGFIIFTHLYINRLFVRPAMGLVGLIEEGEEAALKPEELSRLPRSWRGWFGVLQKNMRERVQARRARDNLARYFSPNVAERLALGAASLQKGKNCDVAVIFADIRGFTSMSEKHSPEYMMQMLRGFQSRMSEKIFAYDGTIEKYIGDALLAVFGVPEAHEDDASRALLCSFEMFASLAEWNLGRIEKGEEAIEIGIGLHFGEAIAGDVGSEFVLSYAVIGDTVNTASRLQSLTRKVEAQMVVSAALVERIKIEQEKSQNLEIKALLEQLEPIGAHVLRGKTNQLELYALHKSEI